MSFIHINNINLAIPKNLQLLNFRSLCLEIIFYWLFAEPLQLLALLSLDWQVGLATGRV